MTAVIRQIQSGDDEEWLRMRIALWSDAPREELVSEMPVWLQGQGCLVLVAERQSGGLCGFLEVAVRPCAVNGEIGRFGHVEGWYVDPDMRKQHIGAALMKAAEDWARQQNCRELHSDAHLENTISQTAHQALGFKEIGRLVHLGKPLN